MEIVPVAAAATAASKMWKQDVSLPAVSCRSTGHEQHTETVEGAMRGWFKAAATKVPQQKQSLNNVVVSLSIDRFVCYYCPRMADRGCWGWRWRGVSIRKSTLVNSKSTGPFIST